MQRPTGNCCKLPLKLRVFAVDQVNGGCLLDQKHAALMLHGLCMRAVMGSEREEPHFASTMQSCR